MVFEFFRTNHALIAALAVLLALSACSGDDDAASSSSAADTGIAIPFDAGTAAEDTAAGSDTTKDISEPDVAPDVSTDANSPADTSQDTTPTATCPGAPECSCAANEDCSDGLCIETPLGRRCAKPCVDGCDGAQVCTPLKSGEGLDKKVCLPAWGRLCQPCAASKDCETKGVKTAKCVDQGKSGQFCGFACDTNDDCPTGYGCKVVNDTEGGKGKQCVRLPSEAGVEFGICACWPVSKADGLSTKCFANQIDLQGAVVGKCPGQRICGQTGLGQCILIGAKAELCDGVDNDCNGTVDDNPTGCAADEVCVSGKCSKACSPVDGGWSPWSAFSACSVSCGGGIRTATRTCSSPTPSCGGMTCSGDASKTEPCNSEPCGGTGLSKGTSVFTKGAEVITGTIPAGVSKATIGLWGGGGGGCFPGTGGGGAFVQVELKVNAGDSITLRVASGGEPKGGGGGASSVALNGLVVAIAGGGGGAGCDGCSGCSGADTIGAGGAGGKVGAAAQSGTANNKYNTNSGGGAGASATAAGAGGTQNNKSAYSGCESQGIVGAKDAGGPCAGGHQCKPGPQAKGEVGGSACKGNGTGGAGGAGYYGGGSGAAKYTYSGGGGGGGSSWVDSSAALISSEAGNFATPGGASASNYQGKAAAGGQGQNQSFQKTFPGRDGLIVLTL
ncbi:MAG TPA: hypothetical protein DCQ06_00870 [Myxococcales bacterium]|nr:hypothetical protein [Myxococcales bacterium]